MATSAQMTNRPQWGQNAEHKYSHYFSQQGAESPVDVTVSTNITRHSGTHPAGCATNTITLFNPAELCAVLNNNVRLDKAFVESTLHTYRPILRPRDVGDWTFDESPSSVPQVANIETEFYAWYLWLVASPVAHAVCYALNLRGANIDIRGVMRADEVRRTIGGGATDIVQHWFEWRDGVAWTKTCILHEFKRDNVLRVDDQCTLAHLIIDEMIQAENGHLVVTTQTQYVLVRLRPSLQLEISEVYSIRNSPTQLEDIAILVLFCTLATAGQGTSYPQQTEVWRVHIPQFPTWVLQPYQGVFWDGARKQQTKFCKPRNSFLLPLSWLGLEGEVQLAANDVSITHGQLLLFFLAAHVVAKIAHGVAAAQRLDREFLAYSALRTWQGVAIPRIFGLYMSTDQTTKVLLMSDAGKALRDFSDLDDKP
ncbi:hypothetical protein DFH07DRAFT_974358 [Mycena maculata]|uniref:Uncharacterized protein n=1 Tax=Mycena maculata TaxID=230809 RepID=A0AAD7H8U5_9AGAR|nr:hypothetical protein DFH07DRAFT_974358 [Mycena maculata]